MGDVRLNLARKWRAKGFDQIIGQDITIRILKNSLYVGNYFPVYLLWGQRGSGKTSTARVFAAAINCEKLAEFRSDPKVHLVPCMQCTSCKAMLSGKHPDFIEIDAASHTGVDHVRQIIDAASLMPLLGKKKIYLIDESHMLSKAAFNAFLKILEEPPASVLFMLATTDPEKIIETVKSRCFQLFFKPVALNQLTKHLETICNVEEIEFERDALMAIAKESSGSVRDAINLLEQVRFSAKSVTKNSVIKALGHIDDERLLKLFEILLQHGTTVLLPFLNDLNMRLFSAEHLWIRMLSLIRATIWFKHGLMPNAFHEYIEQLKGLAQQVSLKKLTRLLERFYNQEPFFLKTTDKHLFLEILMLQACQSNDTTNNSSMTPAAPPTAPIPDGDEQDSEYEYVEEEEEIEEDDDQENEDEAKSVKSSQGGSASAKWNDVVSRVEQLEEPLLSSIFKQANFTAFEEETGKITVVFNKELAFFNEWLDNSRKLWHPLLENSFGKNVVFNPLFSGEGSKMASADQKTTTLNVEKTNNDVKNETKAPVANNITRDSYVKRPMGKPTFARHFKNSGRTPYKVVDVSDVECWKKSNILLRHFSGVVSEVV